MTLQLCKEGVGGLIL